MLFIQYSHNKSAFPHSRVHGFWVLAKKNYDLPQFRPHRYTHSQAVFSIVVKCTCIRVDSWKFRLVSIQKTNEASLKKCQKPRVYLMFVEVYVSTFLSFRQFKHKNATIGIAICTNLIIWMKNIWLWPSPKLL